MATLISRADGNFTTAATWGLSATGMINDGSASTTTVSTANVDSTAFTLPAEAIDAVLIKVSSIGAALPGTLDVILRRTSGAGSPVDERTVNIDLSIWPTNIHGWLIVPFSSFTAGGSDTFVLRMKRSSSTNTLSIIVSATTNFARMFRRTTTQAPAAGDQLIICGEYAGSTTLNARTVTMDNTATTTFGDLVATYKEALFIGMGGKLTWANSASTNYYLRFKGIFKVAGSGVLEMYTATSSTGSLPSTSTAVLEMDCTAAGDTEVVLGTTASATQGGTWTLNGQIKGTTGTVTGATNATPIEITDVAHGLDTGAGIVIESVGGNTNANGTWWVTKTGADTYTLDNSTGNAAYTSGGTRTSRIASKMATASSLASDSVSMGCLVTTSSATITWAEGQKFDTGWTGNFVIDGTVRTISSVSSTTVMVATTSVSLAGTNHLIKLGTGGPKTMKLGDTGFIAAGDILQIASSGSRAADSSIGIVASVDSATQVTLDNIPSHYIVKVTNGSANVTLARGKAFTTGAGWNSATCTINGNSYTVSSVTNGGVLTLTGNYSQSSDELAYLEITTAALSVGGSAYASGLSDASSSWTGGDIRAEVVNISRNVMVRSLGQAGNTAGLFGLIHIYSNDAVVNWNYGEFSLLGTASSPSNGIYIIANSLGTVNIKYCSFHDWWATNTTAINLTSSSGSFTVTNNTITNFVSGIAITATSGIHNLNGSILIQGSAIAISASDNGASLSYITIACMLLTAIFRYGETSVGINTATNITYHSGAGGFFSCQTGVYGELKRVTIWRMSSGNGIYVSTAAIASPFTQFIFSDLVTFGNANQHFLLSVTLQGSQLSLIRPTLNAGVNVITPIAFNLTSCGVINIIDGHIGDTTSFSTACILGTGNAGPAILATNTTWGGTVVSAFAAGCAATTYVSSIKHNGVSGDNRVWLPYGVNTNTGCLATDTTLYVNSSPSLRCYPGSATFKVQLGPFYVPVKSGVNPTCSVKIRKSASGSGDSASYNGNQPRLALLANQAIGYSMDSTIANFGGSFSAILATCSGTAGSWETLTFSLPTAPTADGVVAIVIDCDGTAGWINVDDFQVLAPSTQGTGFWHGDFVGPVMGGQPAQFSVPLTRKVR